MVTEKDSSKESTLKTEELGMSDLIKLMHFMVQQEQKRAQERMEEKKRYERERREEKERYERDRRLEIERQERKWLELEQQDEKQRLELECKETRERLEQMKLQRKEELQRLQNVMKLKEVNMTKLNPTNDIENYLTKFEPTANTFQWQKEKWVVKLVPCLTGKPQAAHTCCHVNYEKQRL